MSNLIDQLIVANGFSPTTAKKTALKDSLEWKNLFDKVMLNFFDQEQSNGTKNSVTSKTNHTVREAMDKNVPNKHDSSIDNRNVNFDKSEVRIEQSTGNKSSLSAEMAISKAANQNQFAPGSFFTDKEILQMKNAAASNSAEKNVFRFPISSISHNLARVHLIKTKVGVKLFMRDYSSGKNDVLEILKNVVAKINHSEIAIYEIKLNGKVINL